MSNKIFHSSIMAVAAGLIITMSVSCGKTPVDGGDEADGTGVIDIRTSIDALTKAPVLDEEGKGNFSRGDIFTVTVSGSGFASTGRNYAAGITELMWKDLDLPEDVGDVYFPAVILCRKQQWMVYSHLLFLRQKKRIFCWPGR